WSGQARTLAAIPAARRLVIRTGEISSSLGRLANFLDVPIEMLIAERSHARRTTAKFEMLRRLDPGLVRKKFAVAVECESMKEWFPGLTLESFREGLDVPEARERGAAPAPGATPRPPVGYWLG